MDGSPALYFYGEGSNDKIIIFLEGGGYCNGYDGDDDTNNCDVRKKEALGSSTFITDDPTSITPLDSAVFEGWHKVYVPYCSGDEWAGRRKEADSHGSYFSGNFVIEGVL